jgi:DNA-binding Lrp family transcriptional regulator
MDVDALDIKILNIIKNDARLSAIKVAKRLKVSPTTVRRRMKKLTRSGAVLVTTMVDPSKIGINFLAIIGLDVDVGNIDQVSAILQKLPEVNWLATTTGRFDLLLGAGFHSLSEITEFIQVKMADGVRDIEIFLCLDSKKGRYVPL